MRGMSRATFVHTQEVRGSSPCAPTKSQPLRISVLRFPLFPVAVP